MKRAENKKIIGWREWVSLPELGIKEIKAKVDTGARSSSIHVFNLKVYEKDNKQFARFKVHPSQDNTLETVECDIEILEFRKVKSSNGSTEERPVIVSNIGLLGETWPVEITLTNRDEMGFRMLLGRTSFRDKFLVDAGKSFYSTKIGKK